ncbi:MULTISPECIES: nitrogenase component 1 [unclassified Pseudodesulfovibrio]|uniref:nitrogenase component 1 n=1 Tax=unclassified Pseudodesulfovibrio TaxID=2661612 RepID=UPI000FEBD532|nr:MULTISPECIES: nitrogenase component 1 [unclassified Pseudodesulfovibrio]MCJ2163476.1 nitrogenase [Pseudodesulfovibrio sp. S3-i]RWU06712.1 nitrogenase [Pseudodesulfovibrio sp. S3]
MSKPVSIKKVKPNYVSTTNACKLCTPLGASLAFRGVEGAIPFLHGSQGCATYMRRYIISHFREPVDIASSALGEKNAIYGGGPNLKKGILNVMKKYEPSLIGVATTCLTETIGDDVPRNLKEFRSEFGDLDLPDLVEVSTPSFSGTHTDGWHGAVRSLVEQLCTTRSADTGRVNILPNMVSCEDVRHLKDICRDFGIHATILPDISETLDGPALEDYVKIPSGGTPVAEIKEMSGARGTIEFGRCLPKATGGTSLEKTFGVKNHRIGLPMGLRESDRLFETLETISGKPMPRRYELERGRLVDAYVDGHKYVFGKRAVVYGEEDLVTGLCAFLSEIGVDVVLAGTGSRKKGLDAAIAQVTNGVARMAPEVREGVDFFDISEEAASLKPDLLIGHSKGYRYAKAWGIPLIRVGFPIHDRFGGQRIHHLGYRGAQTLFDRVVNAVIEKKQADSSIGYGYI